MKRFLSRRPFLALLGTLVLGATAAVAGGSVHGAQAPNRVTADNCTPPGLEILTDPAGDPLPPGAGLPEHDVRLLSIGEPDFNQIPAVGKVVFTLKMESLATIPPQTTWPVAFDAPGDPDPAVPSRWVAMTTVPPFGTPTTPAFVYGTGGVSAVLALGTIDPESSFSADGTIKLVASYDKIGNPTVGGVLVGFLTRIRGDLGGVSITPDNMPDDLIPAGSYTLVGNCNPTAVSLTSFRARSEQGRVAVTWRTASQSGVLGFNLWRSGTKVNRILVAAHGGLAGASYRFVDRAARPGVPYTYRLQTVYRDGTRAWSHSTRVVARR